MTREHPSQNALFSLNLHNFPTFSYILPTSDKFSGFLPNQKMFAIFPPPYNPRLRSTSSMTNQSAIVSFLSGDITRSLPIRYIRRHWKQLITLNKKIQINNEELKRPFPREPLLTSEVILNVKAFWNVTHNMAQ